MDKLLDLRNTLFWKALLKVQEAALVVCTAACVLILCAEVVLRMFHKDLFGYEEIVVIFAMWMYFLGASYAMYQKSHINADMTSLFFGERVQAVVKLIVSFITTFVAIVLTIWGHSFFSWALGKTATTTALRIPLIYSQSALFFGYLLIAFYSLFYFIEDTLCFFRGVKREQGQEEATSG